MVGEAKARRVTRVSRICFEASFGSTSEGKYEGRLTMARRHNVYRVKGDSWPFWCTELISRSE